MGTHALRKAFLLPILQVLQMVSKAAYLTAGNRSAVGSEQHHKLLSHIHRISTVMLGSKFHNALNREASL